MVGVGVEIHNIMAAAKMANGISVDKIADQLLSDPDFHFADAIVRLNQEGNILEKIALSKAVVQAVGETAELMSGEIIPTDDVMFFVMGAYDAGMLALKGAATAIENIGIGGIARLRNEFGFLRTGIGGKITGYTNHGLMQAIGRNGGKGVNIKAILDSVRNPLRIQQQVDGAIKYIGREATTILNKAGEVITTYGKPRVP